MEDNQNYGQQPYGGDQQYNQQPYGADQQYNQQPYGADQQYNQQPYGAGQQPYNQQASYGQPMKPIVYDALPSNHSGVSTAALICGIMSIVFFWIPFLDLGLSIAGVICAIVSLAKKFDGKGMAIGGLVTGIIGLLAGLFYMFCFFIAVALGF